MNQACASRKPRNRSVPAAALAAAIAAGLAGNAPGAIASDGGALVAQAGPAPQSQRPRAVRLKIAPIMDPSGFERPMVAVVALIPQQWRTRGGVVWGRQGTCGTGYQFEWTAASPDGAMAASLFPGLQWGFSNFAAMAMPGCPSLRIGNVQQYLAFVAQRNRRGARVLDFRRRPDIERDFQQLNKVTPMPLGEIRTWVEAGEVLVGYQAGGRAVRETFSALVVFNLTRMRGAYPGQMIETLIGAAQPGFAFRAPHGYLDLRLAETIRTSFKPNPQWASRINRHNTTIARMNIDGARKRSQITTETYDEIRRMNRESYEMRNRIQDRMHRKFSEAIRGVETYDDPMSPTGQVQLNNQYRHAYRLNDGTYVLTDQESFNPYAVFGQGGTKLRRKP